jgi:hypothetical protein
MGNKKLRRETGMSTRATPVLELLETLDRVPGPLLGVLR